MPPRDTSKTKTCLTFNLFLSLFFLFIALRTERTKVYPEGGDLAKLSKKCPVAVEDMEQVVSAEVDVDSDGLDLTPETAKYQFSYSFTYSLYSMRK